MENQHSKQNNDGEGKGKGKRKNGDEIFSSTTWATIEKVKSKQRRSHSKAFCTLQDNTSKGYEWLLPGWVVEERHMASGRIYKYYYDPEGNLYYRKFQVLAAWEKAGIVVLDDK